MFKIEQRELIIKVISNNKHKKFGRELINATLLLHLLLLLILFYFYVNYVT